MPWPYEFEFTFDDYTGIKYRIDVKIHQQYDLGPYIHQQYHLKPEIVEGR